MHLYSRDSEIGVFSSPEPKAQRSGAYRIGRHPASVRRRRQRRPPFSKIFSSETAWPIKAKFYVKHLWEGGTNKQSRSHDQDGSMPIYGKNL